MYDLYPGASIGPYPYRIVHRLGGGPSRMSEVYLATVLKPFQPKQGLATVVLKIAASEKLETNNRSIRKEEEHLPRLTHPGIVRIHPVWSEDDPGRALGYRARSRLPGEPWFCVFEYVPGYSLAYLRHSAKWRVSTRYAINLLIGVAEAVRYLHERQIVHLDIKPSNILLREKGFICLGDPVLIDFGICGKVGQRSSGGTAGYMAPERQPEYKEVAADPSMDIYGLGIVMRELLKPRRSPSRRAMVGKVGKSSYGDCVHEILDSVLHEDWKQRPVIQTLLARLKELKTRLKPYHWLWIALLVLGNTCLLPINQNLLIQIC